MSTTVSRVSTSWSFSMSFIIPKIDSRSCGTACSGARPRLTPGRASQPIRSVVSWGVDVDCCGRRAQLLVHSVVPNGSGYSSKGVTLELRALRIIETRHSRTPPFNMVARAAPA